jgi:small subunit ribosomal protein S2
MADVTMRRMLEAGVHFGHQTRFWNPKMAEFIFGERNKIHIINLEQTVPRYKAASEFVRKLVADGGTLLFVGSKRAAREAMATEAARCGMPYVTQRWLGGMLTNFKTIRQSIKRLKTLEEITEPGAAVEFTKKEILRLVREKEKLEKTLGGIKNMDALPSAVFLIDVGHEEIAVREARKLNIPIVAVVDTNCSPEGIDHPIPGNDDAMRAIQIMLARLADGVLRGNQDWKVREAILRKQEEDRRRVDEKRREEIRRRQRAEAEQRKRRDEAEKKARESAARQAAIDAGEDVGPIEEEPPETPDVEEEPPAAAEE